MKPVLFFILKLICIPLQVTSDAVNLLTAFILWDKKYVPDSDTGERLFNWK